MSILNIFVVVLSLASLIVPSLTLKCNCEATGNLTRAGGQVSIESSFSQQSSFLSGDCKDNQCEAKSATSRYTPRCAKVRGWYLRNSLNLTGTVYDCQLVQSRIKNECYDKPITENGQIRGQISYCFCFGKLCNSAFALKSLGPLLIIPMSYLGLRNII